MNYIEERPWGKFEIIYESDQIKVKKITVNPYSRLSLQSHNHREEEWTVVEGVLGVSYGEHVDDIFEVYVHVAGSKHIPQGVIHRAFNDTSKKAVFIEIQKGTYFGEDDILRYEDDYGRD